MTAQRETAMSRERVLREQRGQGLAERGCVRREGDAFVVSTLSFRRGAKEYKVSRDEQERVRCTCGDYEQETEHAPARHCEHIYAIKFWQKKTREWQAQVDEIEARLNGEHTGVPPEEDVMSVENSSSNLALVTTADVSNNGQPSTEAGVEKARFEFQNALHLLRQPIDARLIRVREGWTDRRGNKHMVEYVEWHTVADILDRTFPSWSHRVQSITQIGGTVAVVASITIGDVTREGVGTGGCDTETGIKKAEHDALKRAAVKFGIARELYQRETEVIGTEGGGIVTGKVSNSFGGDARNNRGKEPEGFRGFPQDPRARGMNDLVTPKQLGMISRMAREAGVNAEKECHQLMACKLEDLSKRAASSLIDYLKESPDSANKTERRAS